MSIFTRQYTKLLRPEKRISRSLIRPRNIYRITTYKGGNPPTKAADASRYIFVIGILGEKVHCIKLNPINTLHFTQLIAKLRDKRQPVSSDLRLEYMLKKFDPTGNNLFDSHIKNNAKLYNKEFKIIEHILQIRLQMFSKSDLNKKF